MQAVGTAIVATNVLFQDNNATQGMVGARPIEQQCCYYVVHVHLSAVAMNTVCVYGAKSVCVRVRVFVFVFVFV